MIEEAKSKEILKMNMDVIKGNLQTLMKINNMSQRKLAHAINVEPAFLCYFFRRGGNCTVKLLGKMAETFDTTLSELTKK